jgi:hypothetical protein
MRSVSCIIFHCLKRLGFSTPIGSPTSSRKLTILKGDAASGLCALYFLVITLFSLFVRLWHAAIFVVETALRRRLHRILAPVK